MKIKRNLLPALILLLSLVFSVSCFAGSDQIQGDNQVSVGGGSGNDNVNYYPEESAGMIGTEVDQTAASNVSQDDAYAENNDGDDTYVSNDGTVFQIPRVDDKSACIYDFAGLFTDDEIAELTEKIRKLQDKKGADIIILTSNDVPRDAYYSTETSMRYARQFLVDNGFDGDSFVCIIDMNNRVFWACGYGKYGTEKYAGWGQKVYEKVSKYLTERNYDKAAKIYIKEIDRLDNPLMAAIPTALSLIISGVISLLTMLGFNVHHSSTQPSKANTPAVAVKGYQSKKHDEHYLGTTVHRRHIERNHSSGGGGGGGGFSGGGFSSGSGGSFSGGGGHF